MSIQLSIISLFQVVTLSVHVFFGACLIGRQYVQEDDDNPDFYVPFFTLLQFFFYMGWLKVKFTTIYRIILYFMLHIQQLTDTAGQAKPLLYICNTE